MHQVVRTIYRQHRRTLFGILFGLVFSTIVAYATPPGSAYTPGETLDPTCDPGSANCTVAIDNSHTLQAVTDAGNTTTNSIIVQGATITANATKESTGFGIGIGNPAAGIGNTFIGYRTGEGITGGDAVTLIGEMNGINQSSTDVVAIGSNNFYQNSGNATYALGDGNGFNNSFSNVVFLGTNGTATADNQLVFSTENNPTLLSPVARFDFNALSDNRQYNLPDADGTLALTSNLSSWLTGTLTGDITLNLNANTLKFVGGGLVFGTGTVSSGNAAFGSDNTVNNGIAQGASFAFGEVQTIEGEANTALYGYGNSIIGANDALVGGTGSAVFAVGAIALGVAANANNIESIAFGSNNTTNGDYAIVAGGLSNGAGGLHGGVFAGTLNSSSGTNSVVVGGTGNAANGINSVVLGGTGITGNADNTAYVLYMHAGSTAVSDGTTLLTLEDTNSTCAFTANTGGPVCGSDQTLKKDISSLDNGDLLTRVSSLNPVSYHWLTDADGAPLQYGFIAQDVAQQFPELVTDRTWIDGTTRKFLNMGGLMPYAIGAIKELNLRISPLPIFTDVTLANTARIFLDEVAHGVVRSKRLCAEDVCIDKTQLQELLDYVHAQQTPPIENRDDATNIDQDQKSEDLPTNPPLQEETLGDMAEQ